MSTALETHPGAARADERRRSASLIPNWHSREVRCVFCLLFKAAPPRRRIRWACCFREERLRQLCTVLTHPLLRYQPLISSEFPKVRHVVRVVVPPRLAALPTQASRLPSEFRFLGFLSQSLVVPSTDQRRLFGELLIQVRVPTQTLPADKRRSWAIRTTAWTPLRR